MNNLKKLNGNLRGCVGRILVLLFIDVIICGVMLANPTGASTVNWQLYGVHYRAWNSGEYVQDESYTIGIDASVLFTPCWHSIAGSAIAGDNGERSLRVYVSSYFEGEVGGGFRQGDAGCWAAQTWLFSLDHAAPLEITYSLDASFLKSGPYGQGGLYVDMLVLRSHWGGYPEWLAGYHLESGESQEFLEEGASVFYYDPSWNYTLSMYIQAGAGMSASGFIPYFQSTVITDISDFSVDITEVSTSIVPVPTALWLVLVGLGTAGWLRRRRAL